MHPQNRLLRLSDTLPASTSLHCALLAGRCSQATHCTHWGAHNSQKDLRWTVSWGAVTQQQTGSPAWETCVALLAKSSNPCGKVALHQAECWSTGCKDPRPKDPITSFTQPCFLCLLQGHTGTAPGPWPSERSGGIRGAQSCCSGSCRLPAW